MFKTLKDKIQDGAVHGYAAVTNTLSCQRGQGMVEYGLIVALIAVVALAALRGLGVNITGIFTKAAAGLQ